jgi:predicted nucleic acid-binding protein
VIIISDTNILSSLASADASSLLLQLFSRADICIPPAVHQELKVGLSRKQLHLEAVLQAIDNNKLKILELSTKEQSLAQSLPPKLNAGESEAIALCQNRKLPLLSNDKRAIRYCNNHGINVTDLPTVLNLLWTRGVIKKKEVDVLIDKMERRENLKLTSSQRTKVFASPPRRRRRRRRGKY